MVDIVSSEVRSRMMSGIREKDTRPELLIRKSLHAKGFRYRLHVKNLPGKPDLVFPKYKAVILVHGCFWHGHDCHLFKWPSSRKGFWKKKIIRNQEKDLENLVALKQIGWRVMTIWECVLKGRTRLPFENTMNNLSLWLESDNKMKEIKGKKERKVG